MRLILPHILSVVFLAHFCLGSQTYLTSNTTSIRPIHKFPQGSWVENIAIRQGGSALVTFVSAPNVYQVDTTGEANPILIHQFSNATSTTGITELEPDVFAVVVGTIDISTSVSVPLEGSFSVHRIDLRHFPETPAKVELIAALPEARLLNGLTALTPSSILVSDSVLGVVFHVDVPSNSYTTAFDLASMKPVPGPILIGFNGIRTFNNHLYYTNSFDLSLWRVPFIVRSNGQIKANLDKDKQDAEKLPFASNLGDDLAIDDKGDVYVAGYMSNSIEKVRVSGDGHRSAIIAQDEVLLAGSTSIAVGRNQMDEDEDVLYVGTSQGRVTAVYGAKSAIV